MKKDSEPLYPDDEVPLPQHNGRGALSNASSRFDDEKKIRTTDGWDAEDELPPLRTTLTRDATRTILARTQADELYSAWAAGKRAPALESAWRARESGPAPRGADLDTGFAAVKFQEQRVLHRLDADEIQDIPRQQLERVSAIPEAIDRHRHAHCHDDPGRLLLEDRPVHRMLGIFARDQIGVAPDRLAIAKAWFVGVGRVEPMRLIGRVKCKAMTDLVGSDAWPWPSPCHERRQSGW